MTTFITTVIHIMHTRSRIDLLVSFSTCVYAINLMHGVPCLAFWSVVWFGNRPILKNRVYQRHIDHAHVCKLDERFFRVVLDRDPSKRFRCG